MSVQQVNLKRTANAIRTTTGNPGLIVANYFPDEILAIPTGGEYESATFNAPLREISKGLGATYFSLKNIDNTDYFLSANASTINLLKLENDAFNVVSTVTGTFNGFTSTYVPNITISNSKNYAIFSSRHTTSANIKTVVISIDLLNETISLLHTSPIGGLYPTFNQDETRYFSGGGNTHSNLGLYNIANGTLIGTVYSDGHSVIHLKDNYYFTKGSGVNSNCSIIQESASGITRIAYTTITGSSLTYIMSLDETDGTILTFSQSNTTQASILQISYSTDMQNLSVVVLGNVNGGTLTNALFFAERLVFDVVENHDKKIVYTRQGIIYVFDKTDILNPIYIILDTQTHADNKFNLGENYLCYTVSSNGLRLPIIEQKTLIFDKNSDLVFINNNLSNVRIPS